MTATHVGNHKCVITAAFVGLGRFFRMKIWISDLETVSAALFSSEDTLSLGGNEINAEAELNGS